MGFWKKALGIGMAAAGVMTANPMLVSAGASVVAGDIAAEGAKKAAKEQQAAADKAIATQQAAAKKTEQAYQPYTNMGQGASMALGSFMGLPSATGGGGGGSGGGLGVGLGGLPANAQVDAGVRPAGEGIGRAVPRDASAAPDAVAARQTASSYAPSSLGGATTDMVKMRAPTGEVAWIPPTQVPAFEQRGAQRVA